MHVQKFLSLYAMLTIFYYHYYYYYYNNKPGIRNHSQEQLVNGTTKVIDMAHK